MLKNTTKNKKMANILETNSHKHMINIQSFCQNFHHEITDDDDTCEFYYYQKQHKKFEKENKPLLHAVEENGFIFYVEQENILAAVGNNNDDKEEEAFKIYISLFLRWLRVRMSDDIDENTTKVIFLAKSEEAILYLGALTKEMQKIMATNSSKPQLKEELQKNEKFNDYSWWPSRWFIHVVLESPKQIPKVLWELQQVEHLDFSAKRCDDELLEELPREIGLFKDLKYLNVRRLNLSKLPMSLQCCKKLEEIRLEKNEFTTLPVFLFNLPNLKTLYRTGNPLTMTTLKKQTIISEPEEEDEGEDQQQQQQQVEEVQTTKSVLNCDSLKSLCFKSICKQELFDNDHIKINIPKYLKTELWQLYSSHVVCDFCKRGGIVTTGKAYQCEIDLDAFFGCKIVPVHAYVCSKECAEKLAERLNEMNGDIIDLTVPVYHNEEYYEKRRKQRRIGRTRRFVNRVQNRIRFWMFCFQ